MQKLQITCFKLILLLLISTNMQCYPSMAYQFHQPKRNLITCSGGQVDIDGTCQNNDLDETVISSVVELDANTGFKLRWGFDPNIPNTAFFIAEMNQRGFMSFGFGGKTMSNTDVVTMTIQNDAIDLKDCFSVGYSDPPADTTQNVTLLGYSISSSQTKVKFSKVMNSGDSNDFNLVKGAQVELMSTYGSTDNVVQHGVDEKWLADILFDENVNQEGEQQKGASASNTHKAHTWGLLIAWGILADIGILIMRHLKTWSLYMWAHAIIFLVVDFYTIILVIMKIDENIDILSEIDETVVLFHYILGVIFIILLFFQHVFGVILKHLAEAKKGRKDFIGKLKKGHLYNGFFLYILSKVLLLNGAASNALYYDEDVYLSYGVIFLVVGIVAQIISIIIDRSKQNTFKKYIVVQSEEQALKQVTQEHPGKEMLTQLVKQGTLLSEIKTQLNQPNLTFCIYENRICKLNNFQHPGGNYIITKINGREIDRFFFGGYALEGDKRDQYTHSLVSEKFLLDNTIGFLEYPESQNTLTKQTNINDIWKINKIDKITPTTHKINFQANGLKFKNYNKGVEWLGRYFSVKHQNKDKKRLYTTVQCMTQDNIDFRKSIVDYALNNFEGNVNKMPEFSDTLPLVIKEYQFKNTLSGVIANSTIGGDQFQIKGPQGTGLHLNDQSVGKIIILSGGTGILPFLDLLNYQLMKIIYEAAKQSKGEEFAKSNIDIHEIGLGYNFNQIDIQLYSSFIEEKEFLGRDIILPMLQIAKKYNLQHKFSFSAKFTKQCSIEDVNMLNSNFNRQMLQAESKVWGNVQNVLICGPPPMVSAVPVALQGLVDEEKIKFI